MIAQQIIHRQAKGFQPRISFEVSSTSRTSLGLRPGFRRSAASSSTKEMPPSLAKSGPILRGLPQQLSYLYSDIFVRTLQVILLWELCNCHWIKEERVMNGHEILEWSGSQGLERGTSSQGWKPALKCVDMCGNAKAPWGSWVVKTLINIIE